MSKEISLMKDCQLSTLKQAVVLLSQMTELESAGKCHIMTESGYDESVIIGTDMAFISLAKKIIEIIYYSKVGGQKITDFEEESIGNVDSITTNEIKLVFNELADVWPICAYIAKDETAVTAIVNQFK